MNPLMPYSLACIAILACAIALELGAWLGNRVSNRRTCAALLGGLRAAERFLSTSR